jgi:hypothetical protein
MSAAPGLLAFFIGAVLLCAPWWSSTLPASDYPLVVVLGTVFATIGVFAALPGSWQWLRALSFALFMGTFGLVCAALAPTPLHPAADGTLTIGGIAGFVSSGPMPWWARIVAGFFCDRLPRHVGARCLGPCARVLRAETWRRRPAALAAEGEA